MKMIFKILGYTTGLLLLLIAGSLAYFHLNGIPEYEYAPPEAIKQLKAPTDSAHIARGAAIGAMHCVACHAGTDGKLVGKPLVDLPEMFGKLNSLNITQDSIHGIGAWTDGELYYFLRTGIHKDGSWSPPFMPKYNLMADEDLKSVIAWLRSNDSRLAPDQREYPPNQYNLLVKTLGNVLITPPPLPENPILVPDVSDRVAYGKYVADGLSNCYICHSADMLKNDILVPERSVGYYGGGNSLRTPEGMEIFSANLTMDPETGLGNWSRQEFIDAVRFGKKRSGGMVSQPMSPHSMLSDDEVSAIFDYLKTVPAIHNPGLKPQASVQH